VEELELVKRGFDGETVVVQEVRGWKAGSEEKVRIVQASHVQKGDRGCVLVWLNSGRGSSDLV